LLKGLYKTFIKLKVYKEYTTMQRKYNYETQYFNCTREMASSG